MARRGQRSTGKIDAGKLGAKFYLNGFPKSGLHLCAQMLKPMIKQMPKDQYEAPWVGMFQKNSFTTEKAPIDQITFGIGRCREGYFLKGHCGYEPRLSSFLDMLGILHIFIYRDFRDVAISQAYHIRSADNKRLFHPAKDLYQKLGGFNEILAAVIEGIDEYPGIMERWEYYAPWIDKDWVLKMTFEEMRNEPLQSAFKIILYMEERLAKIVRMNVRRNQDIIDHTAKLMVISAERRQQSPTFRKGQIGGWREHFTPDHVELFKKSDAGNWLVQLGYETSEDWRL